MPYDLQPLSGYRPVWFTTHSSSSASKPPVWASHATRPLFALASSLCLRSYALMSGTPGAALDVQSGISDAPGREETLISRPIHTARLHLVHGTPRHSAPSLKLLLIKPYWLSGGAWDHGDLIHEVAQL